MTQKTIIAKTLLFFSLLIGVAAFLFLSQSIPNHVSLETAEPETFRFEITGQPGDKIYADMVIDDETKRVTETLPTTLTYEANVVDFTVVTLDVENQGPFSFEVFRNDESILSKQGKGVYGSVEYRQTKHQKVSRTKINSMSDEDIKTEITSMPQ